MDVLRHFDLLNLQGNLLAYSFYRTLELQTDNTGIPPPAVGSLRYRVKGYID
jgi:CxC2 like cysteine cluster associated with KDZ transposases